MGGYWSASQAGHDFWLTRNGHGTGFWDHYLEFSDDDREQVRTIGKLLTDASHKFGQCDLYAGDDGKIYI